MIENLVTARLPTRFGEFVLRYYQSDFDRKEHLALVKGEVRDAEAVPVRVHSECLTGDVFGSRRCDCGEQLERALSMLGRAERAVLVYLRQEGRGIGLLQKLRAYNLQDQGLDTVEANLHLGHQADERDYRVAALILQDLGVRSIQLITNNPGKIEALQIHGIPVVERISIPASVHSDNLDYLRAKVEKMDHLLTLPPELEPDRQPQD